MMQTCCEAMGIRESNGDPALVRCPVCRTGVAETVGFRAVWWVFVIAEVVIIGSR